jgi:hypothetical protein
MTGRFWVRARNPSYVGFEGLLIKIGGLLDHWAGRAFGVGVVRGDIETTEALSFSISNILAMPVSAKNGPNSLYGKIVLPAQP